MTGAPGAPAAFLQRHVDDILGAGGIALDLACGRGRNARFLARLGQRVLAIDRNPESLGELAAASAGLPLQAVRSDIEREHGIPLKTGSCKTILVFHFLFRPLSAEITRVLAPGGSLFYETFTTDQRALGHGPRRAAFLLRPGELATLFPELRTLAFEEGTTDGPRPRATARLWARKSAGPT